MDPSPVFVTKKKKFQRALLAWYQISARSLPWRKTHDPYAILVSELMLQQTQVDRVLPKFLDWMKRFPNVETLARAQTKTILSHWQGLGYNRRALYLQKIAHTVMKEYSGIFPKTKEELLKLPGIGPYTAGAIMSFAYHADEPIVDTNVQRVVGRIFLGYKKLPQISEEKLWELATALLPKKGKTYDFNQALMDFGSMVCTLPKPKCEVCPMQKICLSYPEIQNAKTAELRYQKKVNEKQYFGQPRRIWRGKILNTLHTTNSPLTYPQIGKAIQEDFSADRLPWLKEVIATLEKDGLVKIKKNKISLP